MTSSERLRRLLTAVVAAVTATAMVAGCGGSEVMPENQALGANPATQTETSTGTDTGTGTGTGTGTAAGAGAGAGTAAGSAAPETGTTPTTVQQADKSALGTAGTGTKDGKAPGGGKSGTNPDATSTAEALVANAAIFGGKAPCKPAALSEVNIGNLSTLSGVLGELFAPLTPALNTFVVSQNACGGLNGHRIKLFQDDDQGDPATAIARATDMIQKHKVLAFVGNIQVLTVDAIVPTIKKYGIPVIGSDMTSNTWFTQPLMFPQGSPPQAVAYGYVAGAVKYHKTKNIGILWCIEVPRSCEQINRAFLEVAPTLGAVVKKSIQVSITAPSYVQQCLELKNAGVETVVLNLDAASQVRLARSCQQVGYRPHVVTYPLAVGNEKQFFGDKWLGNSYVPENTFAWMATTTAAEKYWQASVKKYNPGFETGGAASLGWAAGALLVAASASLSEQNPTTQQLLDTLYSFKGQSWTTLGGLSPSPLTFRAGSTPKVPYCYYYAVTNDANNGWKASSSMPTCTDFIAPSDPQKSI